MNRRELKKIQLFSDKTEFCNAQENCKRCEFVEKGLIYTKCAPQPCEQVYELVKIIQEGLSEDDE